MDSETRQGAKNEIKVIDAYFQSIKPFFEKTIAANRARAAKDDNYLIGIPVGILFFSLIPAIPAILNGLAGIMVKAPTLLVFGLNIPIHSFLFWFIVSAAMSGALLGLCIKISSIKDKAIERKFPPGDLLNDAQIRFAQCYSTMSEIESYRTNRRPAHITTACDHWYEFILFLDNGLELHPRRLIRGLEMEPQYVWKGTAEQKADSLSRIAKKKRHFMPQIQYLLATSAWFKVDPDTEAILKAFDELISKITYRILDRRELGLVAECLRSLCVYLYTRVPDLADAERTKGKLDEEAYTAISIFAKQVKEMTVYQPEQIPKTEPQASTKLKRRANSLVIRLFCNEVLLIRFVSWWLILQIGVGTAIAVFLETVKLLTLDSTLIAMVVGSPLAIAEGMTAIPVRTKSQE
jgi:hypothetical protein